MGVTHRFKGLDLIDRVPEDLWTEVHNIVQEVVIKTIPKTKKCKKTKWLSEEALQIAERRREAKGKGEKERYTYMQVKKQQLEPDMKQWTGSKLGKKYINAVYCHLAYLTYIQRISCKMSDWIKHKPESRLPGEISITSDIQKLPTLWQKAKRN